MNPIAQTSIILGISAAIAAAGSPATTIRNDATTVSPCAWQLVTAKQDTVWTNVLEGGPIKAIAGAAAHAKPYRHLVCADPGVDRYAALCVRH